jgi:hypothetical protein
MYVRAGNAGKEYRWQARSLGFNLKDPANPDLRARVLHGELTPHSLVRLQGADLASKVCLSLSTSLSLSLSLPLSLSLSCSLSLCRPLCPAFAPAVFACVSIVRLPVGVTK